MHTPRWLPLLWACACLSVLLLAASCSADRSDAGAPPSYALAKDEFSVMTYNVWGYGFEDRDGDGQMNDPKPQEERTAAVTVIADNNPDVLAVQEMGSPVVLKEFTYALEEAGLAYDHVEYLRRGHREKNLLLFSRFPIVARQSHSNDTYSIGEANVPVARGFIDIDIQVNPDYRFRILTAHLKAKVFHPLGQTEMRRNEARLLGKHVRAALKEDPELNLLVVGDLNDSYHSAALREVLGKQQRLLVDLRPADYLGDVWTYFSRMNDHYDRIDYMLASAGMLAEVVGEKTRAVRHPLVTQASDHRPLVAVFKARDVQRP